MQDVLAGFDIGGTKVALVVADAHGTQLHRATEPTDSQSDAIERTSGSIVYHGLSDQLRRMLGPALADLPRSRLTAIGIVSAGPIRAGGLWNPPNIVPSGIDESAQTLPRFMPLVEPLRAAYSCPVDLLNDCNGAVLGEVHFGLGAQIADKATLHLAYATISTGFGVGAWDGGRLVLGKHGNAGELGHIVVYPDGLACGCGNRGCVEAYASGSGIVRNARTRYGSLRGRVPPVDEGIERLTPADVFDAAERGDPIARAVIEDAVFAAGVAFSAIANAYDPAVISVGGGIALAHPELIDPIREEMNRHLNVAPPEIRLTPLGAEVTERGAVALARCLSCAG